NLMTYAVAVRLQRGVVFAADTRTNAGIDNVSQFRKLHFWRRTGDRVLVLLTAGNLAVSQSVISIINEQLSPEAPTDRPTLMNVSSMYRAARVVLCSSFFARPAPRAFFRPDRIAVAHSDGHGRRFFSAAEGLSLTNASTAAGCP